MAKKTEVHLVDDLDGSEGAHQDVAFSIEGTSYEIDLSDANYARLVDGLRDFVGAARKVSVATRSSRRQSPRRTTGGEATAIREWARANGHEVSDRGRVSKAVQEAYAAAQSA